MRKPRKVLLLLALPALAAAADFRSAAPIELDRPDSLQRIRLPFEAYRDARPDLADVRVLNAAGEAVPIAWAGEPEPTKEPPAKVALPVFPVSRLPAAGSVAGAEISVRASDGTLVAVKPRGAAKPPEARPAAYVLDASQVKTPIQALLLEWKAAPGLEVVHVSAEASDDLRAWSRVAAGPVVRIEAGGRALSQPRLEFTPRRARYFRLTWQQPEFHLTAAHAEPETPVQRGARAVREAAGAGNKAAELTFDLGARLPVQALRLVPAETNSVVSATFFAKDKPDAEWQRVAAGAFYRLQVEGGEAQSPPIEIGARTARYWMARLAAGSSSGSPPKLQAEWRPAQLVFVTRGAGPYRLAFGDPAAKPATLPVASLVPGYERGAESRLPEARVGAVVAGPEPTRWQRIAAQLDARKAALWAILVLAVAALGFMAWRISRPEPKG